MSQTSGRPRQPADQGRRMKLNIASGRALLVIRDAVAPLYHDDERRLDSLVAVYRRGLILARIFCADAKLAWDAERICAGIRFQRENITENEAAEVAAALAA